MDDVNLGAVISVRGSVVDAYFPNTLPSLQNELHAGDRNEIVVEVSAHLDARTVRGIALTPTQGLARGAPIVDLGETRRQALEAYEAVKAGAGGSGRESAGD